MPTSFRSVAELLLHRVDSTPDAEAITGRLPGGGWRTWSWREVGQEASLLAAGLLARGLQRGDRVAILARTRPEWILADLAILLAGGATTTIYPSNTPTECAFILRDSGSRFLFAEDAAQARRVRGVAERTPGLEATVLLEGADAGAEPLAALRAEGERLLEEDPQAVRRAAEALGPDDLATLIYTSGTTGDPKGVLLTHGNWVHVSEGMDRIAVLTPADKHYLFLPLAHSFAKALEIGAIRLGVHTVVDGDIDRLGEGLRETRPTVMAGVPRVFEKIHGRARARAQAAGPARRALFRWAMEVGREVSRRLEAGEEPRGLLALRHAVADRLVFARVRAALGGRFRYMLSGGAPLDPEVARFFHAAGILILEGYGLTESAAASVVNRPDRYRFGTVGIPLPGVEVRLAEDGEILLRGSGIMRGYHGRPDATAEALDPDGWLHTGDLGAMDGEFLVVTGRKKDIIVTAGGKNIAPQPIENRLKAACPWISEAILLGDRRPYCVAILVLDEEAVRTWADEQGPGDRDLRELAADARLRTLVQGCVDRVNAELPRHATVKRFLLVDRELSREEREITPTLKVRRQVVAKRFAKEIDALYAEPRAVSGEAG